MDKAQNGISGPLNLLLFFGLSGQRRAVLKALIHSLAARPGACLRAGLKRLSSASLARDAPAHPPGRGAD